jgi:uncharacterized protein YutE (UPF0331/DUF86 family)
MLGNVTIRTDSSGFSKYFRFRVLLVLVFWEIEKEKEEETEVEESPVFSQFLKTSKNWQFS